MTYLLNQACTHGASYRYNPYGRLIASSGTLSSANLMRFSSKPWHDHSETHHYGYRFYLPERQRCPNRNPSDGPKFELFPLNNKPNFPFETQSLCCAECRVDSSLAIEPLCGHMHTIKR